MKYDLILHVTPKELQQIHEQNKKVEESGEYNKEQKACLFFVTLIALLQLQSEETDLIMANSSCLKIQSDFTEIKRRISYFH
jgi:hypothetical protein